MLVSDIMEDVSQMLYTLYKKPAKNYTKEDISFLKANDADFLASKIMDYAKGFLATNNEFYTLFDDVLNGLTFYAWQEVDKFNHQRSSFSTWVYMVFRAFIDHEKRFVFAQKRSISNTVNVEFGEERIEKFLLNNGAYKYKVQEDKHIKSDELIPTILKEIEQRTEEDIRYQYLYYWLQGESIMQLLQRFPTAINGTPNKFDKIRRRIVQVIREIRKRYDIECDSDVDFRLWNLHKE